MSSNTLFVGIASGLRPDKGSTRYGPGDLYLTVNGTAYVIELGGDAGHTGGAAAGPQTQGAAGSYYTLDGNGYTTAVASLPGQVVGSIWLVADGTTSQTAWADGTHAVAEGSWELTLFPLAPLLSIRRLTH